MNPYEEEMQRNVESGMTPDRDDLDARAYREVFRALQKDPGYRVPPGFAEKVLHRVTMKQEKALMRDYYWFFAGILFVLSSAVVTLVIIDVRLDFGFLNVMSEYRGLAVFAIIFIAFINWLDKRLVRQKLTG